MKYQDLIGKIEMFHKLALYSDRKSFLQRFEKEAQMGPMTEALKANPAGVSREIANSFKPAYGNIDKNIQRYLNELGSPIKLVVDGQLGPDTQKALDWFRSTHKLPPAIQGQALYTQIANEYNSNSYKYVDLDNPNQNQILFPHEMNEQMAQRNQDTAIGNHPSPFGKPDTKEFVAKQ
jgi:hypothetical protein